MKGAIQTSAAPLADRRDDLYETPAVATAALLSVEPFTGTIWEPACGRGAISDVLKGAGLTVWSTDLVDYGYGFPGIDFLMETRRPEDVQVNAIVTNPPYKLATQFIRHALFDLRVPKVAMLLRLAFLEGQGRSDIMDGGLLRAVYPFRNRLPMMHRDGWQGKKSTSAVPFAWFVWDLSHNGEPIIRRLTASPPTLTMPT